MTSGQAAETKPGREISMHDRKKYRPKRKKALSAAVAAAIVLAFFGVLLLTGHIRIQNDGEGNTDDAAETLPDAPVYTEYDTFSEGASVNDERREDSETAAVRTESSSLKAPESAEILQSVKVSETESASEMTPATETVRFSNTSAPFETTEITEETAAPSGAAGVSGETSAPPESAGASEGMSAPAVPEETPETSPEAETAEMPETLENTETEETAEPAEDTETEELLETSEDAEAAEMPEPFENTEAAKMPETTEKPETTETPGTSTVHEHEWIEITEAIHHDEVYETIHHDAEYEVREVWTTDETAWDETVYSYESYMYMFCSQCGAKMRNKDEYTAHREKTGHLGFYTQNIQEVSGIETIHHSESGHYETELILIRDAYDEQVLVSAAYDEERTAGYRCNSCGAVK